MRVLESLPPRPPKGPLVLAIGVFDGVHVGHQAILRRVAGRARALGGVAAAMTFDRHPLQLVAPKLAPPLLCGEAQKRALMERSGLDLMLRLRFNRRLASMEAVDFVERVLVGRLGVTELVVGHDFAFGRRGLGSLALLADLAARHGFRLHVLPPARVGGAPVSSTRIREAVLNGDLALARRLLGRPFEITGTVVHGDRRGRLLGYPTANVRVDGDLLPPSGVWGGRVRVLSRRPGAWRPFLADLGVRPTFGAGGERRLELHLPGFRGNLYHRRLEAQLLRFLRPEKRFESPEKLVAQVRRDELSYRDWYQRHLSRL